MKAPAREDALNRPEDWQVAVAGSRLGVGHLPMSLSCLIQRGAFLLGKRSVNPSSNLIGDLAN